MTTLTTVKAEVERDRWGRPMIVPPGGGKKKAYQRVTTFVSLLEDTFNLSRWQQRMVALGLADRPDLQLAVTAHREDKDKLNELCQDAIEAAKGRAGATIGTAVHALTELVDRGQELPIMPAEARADLDAYAKVTAPLEMVAIEQFGVLDDLEVAGTWDRIVAYKGRTYIADLKTQSTLDWGTNKIAMQLAVYAHCDAYDITTGQRTPTDVDLNWGIVIHLPAGQGECSLHRVDLAAGWDGVQLAAGVRQWRARKGLLAPASIT